MKSPEAAVPEQTTLTFGRVFPLRCCTSSSTLRLTLLAVWTLESVGVVDDSRPASRTESSPDDPRLLLCLFVQTLPLQSSVSILTPNQVRASPALFCSGQNTFLFFYFFPPLYFTFRRRCISALDLCNGVKERFKGEICAGSSKRLCLSHPQRSAAL